MSGAKALRMDLSTTWRPKGEEMQMGQGNTMLAGSMLYKLTRHSRDQFKGSENTNGSECAKVNAVLGFPSHTHRGIFGTHNCDISEERQRLKGVKRTTAQDKDNEMFLAKYRPTTST